MKINDNEVNQIVHALSPYINGAWAELYGRVSQDKSSFELALLVGEPLRRKLSKTEKQIQEALSNSGINLPCHLSVSSPETNDKHPEIKGLLKKNFSLKKW